MTCHYRHWSCLLLVETNFHFNTTNQKHYQDLGNDKSYAREACEPHTPVGRVRRVRNIANDLLKTLLDSLVTACIEI